MLELLMSGKKTNAPPSAQQLDNAVFATAAASTYGFHHAPVTVGNRIYHFGVYTGSGSALARYYDAGSNSFVQIANVPTSIYGAAAEHYNGKIYIIGGTRGDGTRNAIIYDIETNTYSRGTTNLPDMSYFGVAIKDDTMYFAGVDNTSNLYKYNVITHVLTTVNIGTVAENGSTNTIVAGWLYVHGGRTAANAHLKTAYRVNLDTNAVEQLAELPQALMVAWTRFVWGQYIVLVGGMASSGNSSTTHGYIYYDTINNVYVVRPTPGSIRGFCWCGLVGSTFFMFAGIRGGTGLSDSIRLNIAV